MAFGSGQAQQKVKKKVVAARSAETARANVGGYLGGSGGETAGSADPWAVAAGQIAANPGLANASDDEIIDYIRGHYSPAMSRLLDVPELRQVLIESARDPDLSEEEALARIERTSWWQERSESQRKFDALAAADPREFNAQVDRRMAEILPEWRQYGVDGDVRQLAADSLRLGYNSDQIRQVLAEHLQAESSKDGLDVTSQGYADANTLMQIARNEYFMPMDRLTAERWAIGAIRDGVDPTERWRAYLSEISGNRFGIERNSGLTPADIMAPVKSAIAEALELDPDSIDLLSPEWSKLLSVETKDGATRPATYFEALKFARADPRYAKTKGGNDLAANFAETLSRTFGAVK